MFSHDQIRSLAGRPMVGVDGDTLGTIDTLYVDNDGGTPTFATVNTGAFGATTSFVPLAEATLDGDDVRVPYNKALVKEAPRVDPDQELSPQEEQRLYQHYNIAVADGAAGGADDAMTRSEERLHVGTETTEAGRARLRKFIVSETQTKTVPVSHEEVRIEREPVNESNIDKALAGPELTESEHEVVLTAERPVVAKETVPVERVRLETETVTEQAQVTEEVRKEQIEADGVYPDATPSASPKTAPR